MVFDKTLDYQIDCLIVRPLEYLTQSGYFEDQKFLHALFLLMD